MKNALVIGASGGIGAAVCAQLRKEGVEVTEVSRKIDGLEVTRQDAVARVMTGVSGPFDLIFVALGVLGTPEKSLAAIEAEEMLRILAVNTVGVGLILREVPRLLAKDGRCAVLTARVGSIGDNRLGGWHSYRASKAACNQLVRGAAIEMARTHKEATVIAMHPGTVETPFTARYADRHKTMPAPVAAKKMIAVIDGLRPAQTGRFFDYDGNEIPW